MIIWNYNTNNLKASQVISVALLLLLFVPASAQQRNNMENGYEYVDLGLSVKWATCNIGADMPEDYGVFFAWGETEDRTDGYSSSSYRYYTGTTASPRITKYCTDSQYGLNGFVDNKTVLDPDDDVAHVKWGGNWRMPTMEEFLELRDSCTWTWTTQNGVNGYKVTSNISGYEGLLLVKHA